MSGISISLISQLTCYSFVVDNFPDNVWLRQCGRAAQKSPQSNLRAFCFPTSNDNSLSISG
jgi:hypothetical protein